jgi:small redox-active disulfide protein 2
MEIKVLGSGCKKCKKLEENTKEALQLLGLDAEVEKVTDFEAIASYNVLSTPALVVDGKVIVYGQVPKPRKIADLLSE